MKKFATCLFILLLLMTAQTMQAQQRRPIDNQHPLWMIHIDVWNAADPQKIINLIPDDIKPYVCMNLSLSCQYDTELNIYKMPRCAVRTYRSWASVCQQNGMWFTLQPASGGHTHIQDDDLATFEYFFKAYPNFLGWNYAEQFWGFDEGGDKSSSTQASRIALFAKLVPMHAKYGGFLTISFCGNIWSHGLNPMGMMKRNTSLLQACKKNPEAILWLYKYTTSSCWYNNESMTYGPFIAGLATNYGVRYDNCGWNGALESILGKNNGCKYPGAAGVGTVMEQTCVNGGSVWDGPELIWTEDFQNLGNSTVSGYTRRNWGTFPNFRGVWMDMFRKIIDGTMYIPTREEIIGKTKIVVINDVSSGSDENKYAAWGNLYDGLYKQTDPFNRGNGQWMDNLCYFKSSGRYGAIPIVTGLYDDVAKSIPVQVRKSNYSSRWGTIAKKTADFNSQYPEVSKGDLYVNRYRNQLITYTPYTYLNKNTTATAELPLLYNTCDSLKLSYGKLSSGHIREYADHIDIYLNNFRADTTAVKTDRITVTGVTSQPSFSSNKHSEGAVMASASYNADAATYTITVKHCGPVDLTINCTGAGTDKATDVVPSTALPTPKQPESFKHPIIIEAEDMDYKSVAGVKITNSGVYYPDVQEFSGNGFVDYGSNTGASLRHQLNCKYAGEYYIDIRYSNAKKEANISVIVNGETQKVKTEKLATNEWSKMRVTANLNEGLNELKINNTGAVSMLIDQVIYTPTDIEPEKFLVSVRKSSHGTVSPSKDEYAEGETVTLTVNADNGYQLKELRLVNSVFYTMEKTIKVNQEGNEVTFVMPDDNVTLLPVFGDATGLLNLDFTNTINGAMPEGWRCVQESNEVHEYPSTFSQGARTMVGFQGYQGKALYWRNSCAEYGRQSAFPLSLTPGKYKLAFAMAAWKEKPEYKVSVVNAQTGATVAASEQFYAEPNANGSTSANVSSAVSRELSFTVESKGDYVVSFNDVTTWGGYHEFLLLECILISEGTVEAIDDVDGFGSNIKLVYDLQGRRVASSAIGKGLRIVRTADGKARKVLIK